MEQAVSCRPVIAWARLQSQASSSGIFVYSLSIIPPMLHIHSSTNDAM
jgi:hypothetical protein